MSADLLERRERAVARHDAALNRWWPKKSDPAYRREVLAVVAELEAIADVAAAELPALEHSRTVRWLADAYSDLAREERVASGEDLAHLTQAAAHYHLAESLMAGEDAPRDTAVLNFNYANTLKRFDIRNVALLESAKRRYEQALGYFTTHEPDKVAQVRQALDLVLLGLRIAPIAEVLGRMQKRLDEVNDLLENKASAAEIRRGLDRFLEDGGPRSLVNRIVSVIEDLPDSVRELDEEGRLQVLVSEMLLLSASAPGAKEREQDADVFAALKARMETEIREGRVSVGRQAALRNALSTVDRVMSGRGDDISDLRSRMLEMRAGAAGMIPALKDLSFGLPPPPAGSRAEGAHEEFWAIRRFTMEQLTKGGKPKSETDALVAFAKEQTETDRSILTCGADDSCALQIEAELARPQAVRVREFASRLRPYLADPIWSSAPSPTDPNAVLYGGGDAIGGVLRDWCAARRLTLLVAPIGSRFADSRWRQISAASCAVFDMTSPTAKIRAEFTYEMGIAETLGKPVVVVGMDGVPLPFDLDVPTVTIRREDDLDGVLQAVAAAIYRIPDPGIESSIEATVGEAERRFGGRTDAETRQTLRDLRSRLRPPDPVEIRRGLESLVTFLGRSAPALVTPDWPGGYPVPGDLVLFHVMPFRPDWADEAVAAVEAACDATGCRYVRGDRAIDRDIIGSIWDEISTASHVLADLTGFNENVAFELGIADTLGRPTLVVGQDETVDHLFPMLEKLRAAKYDSKAIASSLGNAVRAWIEG